MAKFIITADSACDCALDELKSKNVSIIFFNYSDGTKTYTDTMDEKNYKQFYLDMKNGTVFKTSQINPQEYYDFFKSLIGQNLPIIHISLGSGVSNTINSIYIASSMLKDENPNVDIRPIDSKLASSGLTLLINKLVEFRDNQLTADEAQEKIMYYVEHLNTFYTTDTLTYFARGGRLSKVEAFLGNALKINPILDCNPAGNLRIVEKVRGANKALEQLIRRVKYQVENPQEQILLICHADNEQRSIDLGERLVKEVGFKDYKLYFMGPIIGAHTGPGLISVYFFGKPRENEIKSLNR